jgi:uncharacterized protein YcaQ
MRRHAPESVSPAQARRIQLGAQGFGGTPAAVPPAGRGATRAGTRQLTSTVARLGLLQLDSVNVFERSHYLPLFARVGAYDRTLADRALFPTRGRYVEYWAHEAALVPVATWPLLRWRMDRYREKSVGDPSSWASANGPMLAFLRRELAERGPTAASAFEHPSSRRRGPWWDWSEVKTGLEVLFRWGEAVSAGRTRFERVYALPEQVLPAEVAGSRPDRTEAQRMLVRQAARALGVGTAADFADYFRMRNDETLVAVRALEEEGELLPVTVPGWPRDT